MSKSEDYLDQLLQGVSGKPDAAKKKTDFDDMDLFSEGTGRASGENDFEEDDFLKEFEREMLEEDDTEEFLRQFERETGSADAGEDDSDKETDLFANLDEIVDSAKREVSDRSSFESMDTMMVDTMNQMEEEPDEGLQDGIADRLESMIAEQQEPESAPAFEAGEDSPEPELGLGAEASAFGLGDSDLMDAFGISSDFADMGSLLGTGEERPEEVFDGLSEPAFGESTISFDSELNASEDTKPEGKQKHKKEHKKEKEKTGDKGSFLANLSQILFGEEEEEEAEKKGEQKEKENAPATQASVAIEDFSDESLQLLKEFSESGSEAAPEPEEKKKAKPKKEKKEKAKKEKVKKEKKKKDKKPKPKKEKKPKPPKEPDNTPPLPKAPVILIFIMAASLLVLILVGTNLVGYSNSFKEAEKAYAKRNYSEAFQQISGVSVKEEDETVYEKYRIMAIVSTGYDSYQGLMDGAAYDMALDALIRSIGRCEKYRSDAETAGCASELEQLESDVETALFAVFGVSREEALTLYGYSDRKEYSAELYRILVRTGFEKVTEE